MGAYAIRPYTGAPKTCLILDPNHRRKTFRGVCFCAPTRVHAKFNGFHISAHDMTRNPPDFRPKPSARGFSGRMQYAPTRVHEKPARFHISPSGYAENPPDFTHPNRDMPKTRPILDPNPWRRTFWGVCFCALYGYMKNPAGFIFPHTCPPKTRPILGANLRRRTFGGVCNTPLHGYMKNLAGFGLCHTT